MKISINLATQAEENETRAFCSRTFETSEGQVQNSYVCDQGRFTVPQMWNVQKQKRQVPRKG